MEELVREAKALGVSPASFVREVFQRLILYSLAYLGLEDYYVFQGGTALRLFYGSPRVSLDMDFTLVERELAKSVGDFSRVLGVVRRALSPYRVDVELTREKLFSEEGLYRCFFVFDTLPWLGRKIKVKLEVIQRNYIGVSFRREVLVLRFPVTVSVGVVVKSPSHLLADKVASLAGGYHRGYVRWRDVFDIYWLVDQLRAKVDPAYLRLEFGTYTEEPSDLVSLIGVLDEILNRGNFSAVRKELERYLHSSMLGNDMVKAYLLTVLSVLNEACRVLGCEAGGVG